MSDGLHLTPEVTLYGDGAVLIRYDAVGYNAAIVDALQGLAENLRFQGPWENIVPGYDSLLISFNPADILPDKAKARIEKVISTRRESSEGLETSQSIIDIPVCYGGEYGPDMAVIERSSGLSEAEITKRHSAQTYRVCMMGFIPGFTFLSEAPKVLHHPRRATPRLSVPAGSVGIAGWQTGIYGLSSPGGWQIIGRTPLAIFDAKRDEPFTLKAGDHIRFVPSDADIFGSAEKPS